MPMRQPVLLPHRGAYATRRVRAFGESARLELRPADAHRPALITIVPDTGARPLPRPFIDHAVDIARTIAGTEATLRTPALTPDEARGFFDAGFSVRSNLALLTHDLDRDLISLTRQANANRSANMRLMRFRRKSTEALLSVDLAAFGTGWEMDHHELILAETATPVTRIRLAVNAQQTLVGFAITGRAGRRGYLQRLAVSPQAQGQGVGTALISDALRWSRRHNVRRLVVNTQMGNQNALRLYRNLGFADAPTGLLLLERAIQ